MKMIKLTTKNSDDGNVYVNPDMITYMVENKPSGKGGRLTTTVFTAYGTFEVLESAECILRETSTRRQDTEWLEDMLAYATNLMSQIGDQIDDEVCATTGPEGDPDRYDIYRLMNAIRAKYPTF